MRRFVWIVLTLVVVGSCNRLPRPAATSSQRGTTSLMLENIDSLMWQQPDSALAVMMQFAASPEADSLGEFEGYYCQLLIAELLYKNDYGQSNREDLLKAVSYFDSLVMTNEADARGSSPQGPSRRDASKCEAFDVVNASDKTMAFLDARAHYIKGVGYYERDSLVEACTEYLNTLRMMESHFGENELVGKKARFMALTYNRLVEIFSAQFMQEPAIYCGKQALVYNEIAPTSPYGSSKILYRIGKQYDKLNVTDSASYYYDLALEHLPDRNDMVYRDIITSQALFEYKKDSIIALDSVRSMAAQAIDETERLARYLFLGIIYHYSGQDDTAKAYLEPVFEKDPSRAALAARVLHDIAIKEGDTIKFNAYAQFLLEDAFVNAENQARVSKLSDLFQTYLQEKQVTASLREQRKAARTTLIVVLTLVVVLAVVVVVLMRRRHMKRLAAQKAEAQRRLSEASQRHDKIERELQTQVDEAMRQVRTMLPQRISDIYYSKVNNRMERIMAEFEAAYPFALEQLATAYPDLNETERQIAVLNFLHFRGKEEAELLGFAENTIMKYRSNLNKKAGSDPISALLA